MLECCFQPQSCLQLFEQAFLDSNGLLTSFCVTSMSECHLGLPGKWKWPQKPVFVSTTVLHSSPSKLQCLNTVHHLKRIKHHSISTPGHQGVDDQPSYNLVTSEHPPWPPNCYRPKGRPFLIPQSCQLAYRQFQGQPQVFQGWNINLRIFKADLSWYHKVVDQPTCSFQGWNIKFIIFKASTSTSECPSTPKKLLLHIIQLWV